MRPEGMLCHSTHFVSTESCSRRLDVGAQEFRLSLRSCGVQRGGGGAWA